MNNDKAQITIEADHLAFSAEILASHFSPLEFEPHSVSGCAIGSTGAIPTRAAVLRPCPGGFVFSAATHEWH